MREMAECYACTLFNMNLPGVLRHPSPRKPPSFGTLIVWKRDHCVGLSCLPFSLTPTPAPGPWPLAPGLPQALLAHVRNGVSAPLQQLPHLAALFAAEAALAVTQPQVGARAH